MTPLTDESRRPFSVKDWPWPLIVLAPLAALAVALRLRMMLVGRSLWLDEAALALNIRGRSFEGLMKPLDLDQAAPIGFLFLEKASVLAFGPTEFALRLFPFLASIASLALIYRFCSSTTGRWSAVVAVGLAGVLPALFYYSGELKRYSSDVASALLILVLASDALRLGLTRARAVALAVSGLVAVWISHPSVFVLAGAGATLIVKELSERKYRAAALMATISAAWLASFAAEYVFFLKDIQSNALLASYWDAGFLKFPPASVKDLREYPVVGFGVFETLFRNPQSDVDLSVRMGVFMASAWMIGVVTLYRQGRRQLLALLVAPIAFAVVASMLHKYPLKSRLALFTAATLPTIAAGIAGLVATRDATNRAIGAILLICAAFLPTMQGAQFLLERPRLHDARTVLARVAEGWQPGDVVVVDHCASIPFRYYRDYGRVPGLDRLTMTETPRDLKVPAEVVEEIAQRKGHPRVWFVLDSSLPDPLDHTPTALKAILDREGKNLESISCRRYSAHLYRFDQDRPAEALAAGPR